MTAARIPSATSTSCAVVRVARSCCSRCAGSSGRAPCATSSRRARTSGTRRRSGSARPRVKLLAFALVRVLRVVRRRRARAPPAGARRGHLRPDREHPRAHDGGGRRARLGARRDPRRGLPQEHGVVQRRRAPAASGSSSSSPGAASGSSSCCGSCPVASGRCSTGRATRGCAAVARRRNLVVPSLIADTGDDPELLTGARRKPAVAVVDERRRAADGAARSSSQRFPTRPVPDVDYFTYPDLALSGGKPNLLSLRSVDVAYGQVQVLFGVSLELRRGRDDRAARHQRRGQVDGAARDLGSRRAEARQHQPRGRRHQRHGPAPASPQQGRHPGAGRARACSRR